MSVSSVIRITQYGNEEGHIDEYSRVGSSDCDLVFYDSEAGKEGYYSLYGLLDVQNPKPTTGREKYNPPYNTLEPDMWTDSPALAPTLSDRFRYAYGRYSGGIRYGKLDRYSGVIISSQDFSISGDFSNNEIVFGGVGSVQDRQVNNVSSTLLMEEPLPASGDVTVYQYDFIVSASPVPFSYRNPVDTDISIRLSNYVYPLSSGTVSLYVDGTENEPLVVTPFYSGLGGFDAVWENVSVFEYDQQVNVEWHVYDTAPTPNEIIFRYWFKTVPDTIGPRISNVSPADNATDVAVDECISFTIRDYETGVNMDTLEFYVNNRLVGADKLTISELSSEDGYSITYCPEENFLYGDEIAVSVYVEDISDNKNYLFYVYSFTTIESKAPVVVSSIPRPCREYIKTDATVEVDIVDGGNGLDSESISIDVDDNPANNRKTPIIYRDQ